MYREDLDLFFSLASFQLFAYPLREPYEPSPPTTLPVARGGSPVVARAMENARGSGGTDDDG